MPVNFEFGWWEWIYTLPLVAGVFWLVRVGMRLAIGPWAGVPLFRQPRTLIWLLTPLLIISSAAAAETKLPMYMRAWISRPFMDAFARRCLSLPPSAPLPQPGWVGLYPVIRVERAYNGGVRLRLPTGICCAVEVIYSPTHVLTHGGAGHELTRVTGDWYFTGWNWRDP